jgi:Glycosyltransferase family 92
MSISICSIQRNRGPWLVEWLAFHMVVGVERFYLYAHRCEDETKNLLKRLGRHYPIVAHEITTETRAQLLAYQHTLDNYAHRDDWTAFIDGDEFLFPTQAYSLKEALIPYTDRPVSAIGVHWVCYGSSGHLEEPSGLILENFTRHSGSDFSANRHIKTIVRGKEEGIIANSSHLFTTPRGTEDDSGNPITRGYDEDKIPSYKALRINHYVTQSYNYFKDTKQNSGAADGSPNHKRSERWFHDHDRNEYDDGIRYRYLLAVKLKIKEIKSHIY